jgi:hypothetical protein
MLLKSVLPKQQHCYVFPTKLCTLAGIELGSSVPEADAMPMRHAAARARTKSYKMAASIPVKTISNLGLRS